jgi:acyl-coenzyme A synthetase/AMP-(fatty) acid ligase
MNIAQDIAQPSPLSHAPLRAIPRAYNFAADILQSNLDAGRAGKLAFIEHRHSGTQGWTDGELAERVERFGHAVRALGLRREERVLLCLPDTIDWLTAFLGAIKAGVVPVPVNTLLTEDDYRFMLEDSRARLLVVSEELYPKFAKTLATIAEPPQVIVSGAATHGHATFEALLAGAARDPVTAPTVCDDICFWLYTSGSTGKPKAAVHTHASLRLTDDLTASRIWTSPRPTSASRWPSSFLLTGSAMRSPSRCRPAPPRCCSRNCRRRKRLLNF